MSTTRRDDERSTRRSSGSRDDRYRNDDRRSSKSSDSNRRRTTERNSDERIRYEDGDSYDDYGRGNKSSKSSGSSNRRPSSDRKPSSSAKGKKNSKKTKRKKKTIILFVIELIVLLVLIGVAYMLFVRLNVTKVGKVDLNEQDITINSGVEENQEMKGYLNIALFGVDSREGDLDKNTRSDTIIIASINQDTGDVKLCSVYRDTFLNIGNDSYTKCNAAYANGGPQQAINMLNMNLDMDITDFVTIGFGGLTDAINELGGVTIDVDEAEISHLNNYQSTMAQELGVDYTPVTETGTQTLNGLQATAYCRIRYTAGDDFKRAERQREVLMATIEKAKTANASQLTEIANKVFDETYTSLDLTEIISMLGNVSTYNVVANDGFPQADMRTTGTIGKNGSCVVAQDLSSNVVWLHEFLFDDNAYTATDQVNAISGVIDSKTSQYLG